MIKRQSLIALIFIFILGPVSVHADFDDLGDSARSVAMGGALTSLADESQSIFINPAGLGYLRRAELSSDYSRLYMGLEDNSNITLSHFVFGIPLTRGPKKAEGDEDLSEQLDIPLPPLQISTNTPAYRQMTFTTDPAIVSREPKKIPRISRYGTLGVLYRKFAVSNAIEETTLGVGWGKAVRKNLNVGFNIKRLEEEYTQDEYTRVDPVFGFGSNGSVSAMSYDIGLIYNFMPRVFWGLSILDILSPDIGLAKSEKLERTFKTGLGFKANTVSIGLDATKKDRQWSVGSGVEKWVRGESLALRSGLIFGRGSLLNVNLGVGFKLGQARMDYAFQYPLSNLDETTGSHRFSLIFKFGKPVPGESDPGSLEEAYLRVQRELIETRARLEEVEGYRDSLEGVLVDETTHRIKERIENERKLAQARARAKKVAKKKARKPEIKVITHRVQKGDTLRSLAQKYFGDSSKWRIIYEDNKKNIGRGGTLKKGQLIVIPATSGKTEPKTAKKKKTRFRSDEPSGKTTHTVKDGETLKDISKQHYGNEADWKKIYTRNKDKIIRGKPEVGAVLVIP